MVNRKYKRKVIPYQSSSTTGIALDFPATKKYEKTKHTINYDDRKEEKEGHKAALLVLLNMLLNLPIDADQ